MPSLQASSRLEGAKDFRAPNGFLKQQFRSGWHIAWHRALFRLLFDVFDCDLDRGLLFVTILTLIVVSVLDMVMFRFRPAWALLRHGLAER